LPSCGSEEHERKVAEKEVPSAVLQAFKAAYPNAEVRGYAEEQEDGKKIYEVSFTHEGKSMDVTYAGDGELFEVEETIDPANLPQAAHNEINNKFKAPQIKRVERVAKSGRLTFEVKVDVQENGALNRYEIVFDQDGKLLKQELDTEDEE
jgi:uncharacterized membrane protein YkoI